MVALGNDRWRGAFTVERARALPLYGHGVGRSLPVLASRLRAPRSKPRTCCLPARVGADLIDAAAKRANGDDRRRLGEWAARLREATDAHALRTVAMDEELAAVAIRYPDRSLATTHPAEFPLVVDRERARFSAWYELFPRSCGAEPGTHGTFRDCEARLPYVAEMGFDVLYLPPIHPIGRERRKGRNNRWRSPPPATSAARGRSAPRRAATRRCIPQLGTLDDFRRLRRARARARARDRARHRVPVRAGPPVRARASGWFRRRPDGSVQYAENPPKKYQDIYPFNFESEHWAELWEELAERVRVLDRRRRAHLPRRQSAHQAVRVLGVGDRADQARAPGRDLPRRGVHAPEGDAPAGEARLHAVVHLLRLAQHQAGADRLFHRAHARPGREYFRPNCWPNTPDILPEYLQFGGRAAFMARLVLAATLSANYGIYGPAFELLEHLPREPGSRGVPRLGEVPAAPLGSRRAPTASPRSSRASTPRGATIRRCSATAACAFFPIDNDELICYAKIDADERTSSWSSSTSIRTTRSRAG